jgi:hypothetical protein
MKPYLQAGRLQDVIAALTALGTYRYYKIDYEKCAEKIANQPGDAQKWKTILGQHPEFFRDSDTTRVSLIWRRQFQKRYSADLQRELDFIEYTALTSAEKGKLSRRPLDAMELTSLIRLAVDLHTRALDEEKTAKWWVPLMQGALALAGVVIGAIITTYFK